MGLESEVDKVLADAGIDVDYCWSNGLNVEGADYEAKIIMEAIDNSFEFGATSYDPATKKISFASYDDNPVARALMEYKVIDKKLLRECYQRSINDIVCIDRLDKDGLRKALKKLAGNVYYVLEKPALDEMLGRGNGWIR